MQQGALLKERVRKAEIEILRYLIAHQEARDSVEGIEKWWLPQSVEYGATDIAGALRNLETRELICVWKSTSAKPVYGLCSGDTHPLEEYLRAIE